MRIDIHPQVGNGFVFFVFVHTVHINDLAYDFHGTRDVLCRLRCTVQCNADNDFCSHLASHVNGIVIFQTAIDQHHAVESHWREGGRDGHGSTYGLRQPSAMEYHLAVVHDVCSHTGERYL